MNVSTLRSEADTPILDIADLNVSFSTRAGDVRVVRDLSFRVARGEVFAVIGESGSGKSTMAQAVMGLLSGDATTTGRITLAGQPTMTLGPRARRRLCGERMALISQDALAALNPCTTVGFQIAETLMVHRGMARRAAMRRAIELLTLTGIPSPEDRVHHYPHEFSGGMRQRALIAIALALEPDLLIADEPTTALDATIKAQILQLLMRLRSELGMAVLIVTHDMGVVARMADRMLVMYAGRAVETGPVTDVFDAPAHPYTRALLKAMPRLDCPGEALRAIAGAPPSPQAIPQGCAFHPRCPLAVPECAAELPRPIVFADGRMTLCRFSPDEVKYAERA
ncbi:oligopeptide transport ATP-binding ABC transport protein [Caballeronia hypogeia]|uniref:Oligopeptide transport ATP-binding ABC transport protein n=1 Tax=Caballeronia hypogeia TaxID=1777140 RepID=A0A158DM79_9BURK|nr:ABC transporter ATP-binding protein [Caballeronia hypogeia]SAK95540.1 oligopeptide transport ATP-binding ABC transport protein [Caballeronia hypogeia]